MSLWAKPSASVGVGMGSSDTGDLDCFVALGRGVWLAAETRYARKKRLMEWSVTARPIAAMLSVRGMCLGQTLTQF